MRWFLILFFCAACLPACKKPTPNGAANEARSNYSHVPDNDAAMELAIATAKRTSGTFLQALRDPKPSDHDFFLKKPYRVGQGNGQEHMWIGEVSEVGDHLEGIIANDAFETKEVKLGQKVSLKLEEISDWKYVDGKRLIGGYTIRYFYDRLKEDEKKAFLLEAGFVID